MLVALKKASIARKIGSLPKDLKQQLIEQARVQIRISIATSLDTAETRQIGMRNMPFSAKTIDKSQKDAYETRNFPALIDRLK